MSYFNSLEYVKALLLWGILLYIYTIYVFEHEILFMKILLKVLDIRTSQKSMFGSKSNNGYVQKQQNIYLNIDFGESL